MKNRWNKRIIGSLTAIILIASLAACQKPAGIRLLGPVEFEKSMSEAGNAKPILVDVRTPEEFSEGHLEGAVNINYKTADFPDNIQKLDKKQTVYIYCRSGGRSASAVNEMQSMGFTSIVELDGGIIAWEESQHKIVK